MAPVLAPGIVFKELQRLLVIPCDMTRQGTFSMTMVSRSGTICSR
jgi:hypothetical protein